MNNIHDLQQINSLWLMTIYIGQIGACNEYDAARCDSIDEKFVEKRNCDGMFIDCLASNELRYINKYISSGWKLNCM